MWLKKWLGILGLATVTVTSPNISEAKKTKGVQTSNFDYHNNFPKVKSAYALLINAKDDKTIRNAARSFVKELYLLIKSLPQKADIMVKDGNIRKDKKRKAQALRNLKKLEDEIFGMLDVIKNKFGNDFKWTEDETLFDLSIGVGRYFVIAENILEGVENPTSVE